MKNDCISRQAALDAFGLSEKTRKYGGDHSGYNTMMLYEIQDVLEELPSVMPDGRYINADELIKRLKQEGLNDAVEIAVKMAGHERAGKRGDRMDDPTKDLIPRSAIKHYLRKETVSTNPDAYEAHEKFIEFMDDPEISQFGRWMHSNGINIALVAIEVDLDKIPSVQPEQKVGHWIDKFAGEYRCSNCRNTISLGDEILMSIKGLQYCPNCGAKMGEQDG